MAVYATWDDVVLSYEQPLPDQQRPRIEALLRQASARLTALVPSLPTRLAARTVDPDLPCGLVVEAVLRVYRNPAGITQQSTGPYSRSLSRDAARNDLYFDPAAVQAMLAGAESTALGVGTFRVAVPRPHVAATALDADRGYLSSPDPTPGL